MKAVRTVQNFDAAKMGIILTFRGHRGRHNLAAVRGSVYKLEDRTPGLAYCTFQFSI